jgi:glycosyltransferase involved in cell wall biosynthesis
VLALDTPFSREVLADEAHGIYFMKEETSVSEAIERLESNPEIRMRLKNTARSRIAEKYTWQGITDQYEQLFDQLMNK